jgi:pimeloyl-ACP methyl ester carboxylesterase
MLDWLRLAAVFSRSRDLHATSDPRCRVEKDLRAGNGWRVDRFVPTKPSGASLVLLHGWTVRGKDDPRLQAFARALAIAGVACQVPQVPGLAALTFDRDDVAGLRALLDECPTPPGPPGIVGFSFGGSYALLAASDHAKQPRFIVSVSGYGNLPAAFRQAMQWGRLRPTDPMASEAWVYQKLVLAWRLRATIPLSVRAQSELQELLVRYCEGTNVAAAWSFCQQVLGNTDWESEDERRLDTATMSALSLAEHPPRLACPVVVLHDKTDQTIPPSEARIIAEAVHRGSPQVRVDVMVTELLNHVTPGLAWRPREILRFLRLLSPLVRS